MKKLVLLSLFSILILNSICHATTYHPLVYKTIKFANIDFDDHVKALDYFIAKWKPLEKPILRPRDFLGREEILYYEEPRGIDGGGGRDIVYENAKYISQLIYASSSSLLAIKRCNEQKEMTLDAIDTAKITDALNIFGQASDTMREYAIRVYTIRQDFQDLTDLHATRAKIIEGQAKLRDILARGPQKKN